MTYSLSVKARFVEDGPSRMPHEKPPSPGASVTAWVAWFIRRFVVRPMEDARKLSLGEPTGMIWRTISPEGLVWRVVFLAATLLVLLGEVDVISTEGWVLVLLLACLSFVTLGLTVEAVQALARRRRPAPQGEDD